MVSQQQMVEFLRTEFPHNRCLVEQLGDRSATIRYPVGDQDLRPGGTVSGPVMMTVADVALYVARGVYAEEHWTFRPGA